jgi:hypothetical protein
MQPLDKGGRNSRKAAAQLQPSTSKRYGLIVGCLAGLSVCTSGAGVTQPHNSLDDAALSFSFLVSFLFKTTTDFDRDAVKLATLKVGPRRYFDDAIWPTSMSADINVMMWPAH